MSDNFIANIKAELDTRRAETQIAALKSKVENALNNLSFDININTSKQNKAIKNYGRDIYKELNQQVSKINKLQVKIKGLDGTANANQIRSLQTLLSDAKNEYVSLCQTVEAQKLSGKQWNNLINSMQKGLDTIATMEAQLQGKMRDRAVNLDAMIDDGKLAGKLSKLQIQIDGLGDGAKSLQRDLGELISLFNRMGDDNAGIDARLEAYQRFEQLLPSVKAKIEAETSAQRTLKKETKELNKEKEILSKSSTLSNNITVWLNKNAEAANRFGDELRDLQDQLKGNVSADKLKDVSLRFSEIKSEANAAGLVTSSFVDNLKKIGIQAIGITSVYEAFSRLKAIIKDGVDTVIELDDALVDLRKTSTMSSSELADFYYEANDAAKELGVTTKDIIETASSWSRLGYSDANSVTKMSELTSAFKIISPEMDMEEATTGLVSIMKAYEIDVNDVLDGIIAKVNIVGNTAATSNAEIVTGLQNSAAALALTGTSLEENIALFTAG